MVHHAHVMDLVVEVGFDRLVEKALVDHWAGQDQRASRRPRDLHRQVRTLLPFHPADEEKAIAPVRLVAWCRLEGKCRYVDSVVNGVATGGPLLSQLAGLELADRGEPRVRVLTGKPRQVG